LLYPLKKKSLQFSGFKRQIFKYTIGKITLWEQYDPSREEDQHQVGVEGEVLLVPELQLSLVGGDVFGIEFGGTHFGFGEQPFFIPEDNGANSGKARLHVVDIGLDVIGIGFKCFVDQRAGTDDAHVSLEDVDKLRKFIDFCLSQDAAQGHQPWIPFGGVQSAGQVRTVFQHGGEFPNAEGLVFVAYSFLEVENIVFASQQ